MSLSPSPKLPTHGVDAAANTDDTYAEVVTCPGWETYHLTVQRFTCDALVAVYSKGGLSTGSLISGEFFIMHGQATLGAIHTFDDLRIPPSAVIVAKNAVATEDYTNLHASVW